MKLIPVTVLTGFLGAGKTTLLNRLLKHPEMDGSAVLINEFGEIGLDHLLVEKLDEDTVLLNAGCLCCTIRGDLQRALRDLALKAEAGRDISRVLIETTGLADPAPILQTLMSDPVALRSFRLDGVVTVVDAGLGAATLDNQIEAVKQAAVADRLILSKTDIAQADQVNALEARLRALNPGAPIRHVVAGDVAPDFLFGTGGFDPAGKIADVADWLDGWDRSRCWSQAIAQVAAENHCGFFDAGTVIETDGVDRIHLTESSHAALGQALTPVVRAFAQG
jgi:G3E family GTPase